ncbi:MAG: sulfoxide reductase heme-binding subunit YedZ [Cellvibrionaceae bacterium]|jgi:sulfoxide reductase heme-binding subunit YedZ
MSSSLQVLFANTLWIKTVINVVALGYLAYLFVGLFLSWLGPNPIETITHETGTWALNFLMATLAVSPVRRWSRWNRLIKYRRFLGLWSFAFVSLHLLVFLFFDHFFDLASMWEDIVDRPYISVGFLAFLLMLPLAVTSYKTLQRRLGKRWLQLHRLIYVIAILAILHYWWLVKADISMPVLYGLITIILLSDRVYLAIKKAREVAPNSHIARR